jgi:hypothetical protein
MSELSKNEQLIHALLDGDLEQQRDREAREMLAADRELGEFYNDCLRQKESIAGLTRFTLNKDFSQQVLRAAEAVPRGLPKAHAVPLTTRRSGGSVWQIATTAIVSSAATLLITTFLLPTHWADHAPVVVNDLPAVSNENRSDGAFVAIEEEYTDGLSIEDAAEVATLSEPPIEQVWLLEAQDNRSSAELARTLEANSILVPAELAVESEDKLTDTLNQEINGILIEASAIQMKKALLELADSQQFEISAFTLPGHEAYFADIRHKQTDGDELPINVKAASVPAIESPEQLAAQAIASAAVDDQDGLKQPPRAMAQQLRPRRFSKKSAIEKTSVSDRKKTLFADGLYSQADGPEGLGASAAPLFGSIESESTTSPQEVQKQAAEKQNVDALFPETPKSGEPKGNYLLLIRTTPQ